MSPLTILQPIVWILGHPLGTAWLENIAFFSYRSYERYCFCVPVCKLQKYHILIGCINKCSRCILLYAVRIWRFMRRKIRRSKPMFHSIKHLTSSKPHPPESGSRWSAAEMCLELKHQRWARCLSKTEAGQTRGSTPPFSPPIYIYINIRWGRPYWPCGGCWWRLSAEGADGGCWWRCMRRVLSEGVCCLNANCYVGGCRGRCCCAADADRTNVAGVDAA